MKNLKKITCILFSLIFLLCGVTVFATTDAGNNEIVFDTAPTITKPVADTSLNPWGVVMWAIIGLITLMGVFYCFYNHFKVRKIEKEILKKQLAKPVLIISQNK